MAWTYFPTQEGHSLSADRLGELLTACSDRGIGSLPSAKSSGASWINLDAWVASLRTAITDAVTSGSSGPFGYWVGSDWWTLTTAATNEASKLKNVFAYTFGSGSNWPRLSIPGTLIGLVLRLNDIQDVLDKLMYRKVAITAYGGAGSGAYGERRVTASPQYHVACSDALSNLGSKAWSSYSTYGHYVQLTLSGSGYAGYQSRGSSYVSQSKPVGATKFWIHVPALQWSCSERLGAAYHNLQRDLVLDYRGTSYEPESISQLRSGSLAASITLSSGTYSSGTETLIEGGDVSINDGAWEYFYHVTTSASDDPTGSGLCALSWTSLITEQVFGEPDWVVVKIKTDKTSD